MNQILFADSKEKELVIKIKETKCNFCKNKLLVKYEKLIKKIARDTLVKFRSISLTEDDIENQLRIDLCRLTYKFEECKGVPFCTFIAMGLKGRAINYCRSFTTNGHKTTNHSSDVYEDYITDTRVEQNQDEELLLEAIRKIECEMTREEVTVLYYHINGGKVNAIEKELGMSKTTFYRHLNTWKDKIKKINDFKI